MGLDMTLYYREKKENIDPDDPENAPVEIQYWRKHNALHNWFNNLYVKKGGDDVFNCVDLILTKEDLINLANDIINEKLSPTAGFFFGDTEYDPLYSAKQDLGAVGEALYQTKLGKEVFYTSWW